MLKKINLICIVVSVFQLMLILFFYNSLPEEIVIHKNITGEPDGYGSKNFIFLFPCINLFLFCILSFLVKRPHVLNYPVKITDYNKTRVYEEGKRLLAFLTMCVFFLTTLVILESTAFYTGEKNLVFSILTVLGILSTCIIPFVFFIRMRKRK